MAMVYLSTQKRSGISKGVQEKPMWSFHGSWLFLTLEFQKSVKQFCKTSSKSEVFMNIFNFILGLLRTEVSSKTGP